MAPRDQRRTEQGPATEEVPRGPATLLPDEPAEAAFERELGETIRLRSRWIWAGAIVVWTVSLLFVDGAVFPSRLEALAIRGPEVAVAAAMWLWLSRPRTRIGLEIATIGAFGVVAFFSARGLEVVPVDKLPVKVASLSISVLVVCLLGSFTWRAVLGSSLMMLLALSVLPSRGASSLYALTLTVVGFAYVAVLVSAAARDRLKRGEFLARRALTSANEELQRQEELRNRLFLGLTHDFRTPLAIVRGEVAMLLEARRAPADVQALARIDKSARALADLTDQLLALARLEASRMPVERRPVDVVLLAREVVALFEHESATLTVESEQQALVAALADPSHVERILTNLVANALRQRVTRVSIVVARTPARVLIDVIDDGPGVPAGRAESIFERFVSFAPDGGTGPGIGLPLARELAVLNGGSLDLVRGTRPTTFRLDLEASDDPPAARSPAGAPRAPHQPGAARSEGAARVVRKVLVVEDHPDMAEVLVRILATRFEVVHVATARAAHAALGSDAFDAVLSDVLLPDGTGYDVLTLIKSSRALERVPLVFVSALSETSERIRGLDAGADDYLSKPFEPRELLARLARAIERAQARHRALELQREGLLMEVHDGVSASLARASVLLAEAPAAGAIDHARRAIGDGLEEVRAIVTLLAARAGTWDDLTAQIRRSTAEACSGAGIAFSFEGSGDGAVPVTPAVAHTLRRIAREATTNVLKHAGARRVVCRLTIDPEAAELRLEDDGRGLPATSAGGHGLGIMQRRAARLGGTFACGPGSAGGTIVAVRVPLGHGGEAAPSG